MGILKFFVFLGLVMHSWSNFFKYVAGQIPLPMPMPWPAAIPIPQPPLSFKSEDRFQNSLMSSDNLASDALSNSEEFVNPTTAGVTNVSSVPSSKETDIFVQEITQIEKGPGPESGNSSGADVTATTPRWARLRRRFKVKLMRVKKPTGGSKFHRPGHPWRKPVSKRPYTWRPVNTDYLYRGGSSLSTRPMPSSSAGGKVSGRESGGGGHGGGGGDDGSGGSGGN